MPSNRLPAVLQRQINNATRQAQDVLLSTPSNIKQGTVNFNSSLSQYLYFASFDDGYISWIQDNQLAWTLRGPAMGPDTATEISTRPIPQEPMVGFNS